MARPDIQTLYAVIEDTWPSAQMTTCGAFHIRRGEGGGSRVTAATLHGNLSADQVRAAENAMTALGQQHLFMIRQGDDDLDRMLANMGYQIKDPVAIYAGSAAEIAKQPLPHKTAFPAWPPLAAQRDIWAKGGIGDARLKVMDRVKCDKITILGRTGEHPAGSVFLGATSGCAMIHALEVEERFRGQGLGRYLTVAGAKWAQSIGCEYLTLLVTEANVVANALYASLGMEVVGHYHYRIKPETVT